MTPEQAVARARSAVGHGAKYALGAGGMNPQRAVPWNEHMQADCDALPLWAIGISRKQGSIWYGCDRVRLDAIDGGTLFQSVPWNEALPGDILVFGSHKNGDGIERHGHMGLVTEAGTTGPILVVHCSSKNWERLSDAIAESGPGLWSVNPATVVARFTAFERVA